MRLLSNLGNAIQQPFGLGEECQFWNEACLNPTVGLGFVVLSGQGVKNKVQNILILRSNGIREVKTLSSTSLVLVELVTGCRDNLKQSYRSRSPKRMTATLRSFRSVSVPFL